MVVVTHQAEKIWTYDCMNVRPTVQGATFNMRDQLYHMHANTTALSSSPVVSALGSKLDNLGSSPGHYALGTCRKKNASSAFRLG